MSSNKCRKNSLSKISRIHFVKLIVRTLILLLFLFRHATQIFDFSSHTLINRSDFMPFLLIIWLIFAIDTVLRFFPSKYDSMGCQKQLKCRYKPPESADTQRLETLKYNKSYLLIAVLWTSVNLIFGFLYLKGIFSVMMMIFIALIYSVCDIICILFYCPFQEWFMKNRCCTNCRIYNWDFAMMYSPLIFIKSIFTVTLCVLAAVLLIQWEFLYHRHPERFFDAGNELLTCKECTEKLCRHKKSIRKFINK